MATPSGECKACGCGLNHADVRQLALYYRQEQPSLAAVRMSVRVAATRSGGHQRPADLERVAPRCSATGRISPANWVWQRASLRRRSRLCRAPHQRPNSRPSPLDEYIDFRPTPDPPQRSGSAAIGRTRLAAAGCVPAGSARRRCSQLFRSACLTGSSAWAIIHPCDDGRDGALEPAYRPHCLGNLHTRHDPTTPSSCFACSSFGRTTGA